MHSGGYTIIQKNPSYRDGERDPSIEKEDIISN